MVSLAGWAGHGIVAGQPASSRTVIVMHRRDELISAWQSRGHEECASGAWSAALLRFSITARKVRAEGGCIGPQSKASLPRLVPEIAADLLLNPMLDPAMRHAASGGTIDSRTLQQWLQAAVRLFLYGMTQAG